MRAIIFAILLGLPAGHAGAQAWMCDVTTDDDTALLNIQRVEPDEGADGAGYVSLLPPESGRLIDWGAEAEFQATEDGYVIRTTSGAPDAVSFQAWLRHGDLVELHDPYGTVWEGACQKWDYPE